LIGAAAKNQSSSNPENTVFDAKRLIGRRFNDSSVQSDMKHCSFFFVFTPTQFPFSDFFPFAGPFKVVDKDSKPIIRVTVDGEVLPRFSSPLPLR